jgi:hypothetical protein
MRLLTLAAWFPFEHGEVLTGTALIVWAVVGSRLPAGYPRLRPPVAVLIGLGGFVAIVYRLAFPFGRTVLPVVGTLLLLAAAVAWIGSLRQAGDVRK